jgi:hypothetical protein
VSLTWQLDGCGVERKLLSNLCPVSTPSPAGEATWVMGSVGVQCMERPCYQQVGAVWADQGQRNSVWEVFHLPNIRTLNLPEMASALFHKGALLIFVSPQVPVPPSHSDIIQNAQKKERSLIFGPRCHR